MDFDRLQSILVDFLLNSVHILQFVGQFVIFAWLRSPRKNRESIRYFTGDQFDTFANQLPSRKSDSCLQIFNIHDFKFFLVILSGKSARNDDFEGFRSSKFVIFA